MLDARVLPGLSAVCHLGSCRSTCLSLYVKTGELARQSPVLEQIYSTDLSRIPSCNARDVAPGIEAHVPESVLAHVCP